MIGLALAGGGVKGSYQIGAYYAFKKCHIKFDCICGTSIGAFNGALLAAKKEKELLEFWQTVDVGKILGFDEKYIKKLNDETKDLEYYKMTFDNFKNIILNKGINIDGLQEELERFNVEPELRKSNIDFGLITFRLKDKKALELFKNEMREGSINNYILASCYLPIFKKEKLEDNSYFFDGGIYDNCPANMMLKKGYSKVYRVELNAIGYRQKLIDKTKVITISPSRRLSNVITFNKKEVLNNIQIGYYDTLKVLKNYPGYKYIFKNRNNAYYRIITSRVDEKTLSKIKVFFGVDSLRDCVINSLEYVMKKDEYSYFEVYNVGSIIRNTKKSKYNHLVYKFIKSLISL